MSYSRWGSSRWYTYWCVGDEYEDRDTALFDICIVETFSAKTLREDIEWCLDKAMAKFNTLYDYPATEDERKELKVYMEEFLRDVDTEYPCAQRPRSGAVGVPLNRLITRGTT